MEHYVQTFRRNGLAGPCNWYRTRELNWRDDLELPVEVRHVIRQPTLYIFASKDNILTRETSAGMERAVPHLTRAEVPAGHWALWQTPRQTNDILQRWLEKLPTVPARL